MDKLFRIYIVSSFLLFLSVAVSPSAMAQTPKQVVDTNYFNKIDEANFDSLLHFFYMQQYAKQATRHQNRRASQMYAEFDNIPDSVFIRRLQNLHTVVPMTYNSEVRAFIKSYVRMMNRRLDAMLSLSEYYFPLFEETLDRYGVPEEMKYLTIVESALNPQATSRAGAAGLWQFIYSSGRSYDLEISSLVDERRDPYKSTVAAARLLRALYKMYGDWQMAMAAYNCGPGNVNKAIARSGGKRTFWEIYPYLPRETRGYVPKYIAATYIMNYYHEHGMTAGHYVLPIQVDTIHLHGNVHMGVVERFTGIPKQQLRQLNPQYRTDVVPASSRVYALCVPSRYLSKFLSNEDSIYKVSKDSINVNAVANVAHSTVIYHKVGKGETWNSIAAKYGVSVSSLRRWNGKSRKSTLKVGSRLKIYQQAPAVAATTQSSDTTKAVSSSPTKTKTHQTKGNDKPANKKVYHTVKKGENLSTIAKKYGTTPQKIRKLNNMKSDVLHSGQRLRIR
ncbi:MAG: LysM peptidoglycan-binding domain-containing protein [Bacteroidales bacterium]|nr:LysM peptidoglycan-binding domain-containing protein [Bacteroidales bacterium]